MILDQIVADKQKELTDSKRRVPLLVLKERAGMRPPPRDLAAAISGNNIKLIAEVKKASPSRGVIRADFDPVKLAGIYASCGAAAISVLTDQQYFQGSLEYLDVINNSLGDKCPPLFRKDFIIDSYQVYESRACGADGFLLIAAILTPARLDELLRLGQRLGMSCIVEVHDESELAIALESGAGIIGINNRNLQTFKVDLDTTARLRPLIPGDRLVVSESGIKTRGDVLFLEKLRVNAMLVGEALMSAPDTAQKIRELL